MGSCLIKRITVVRIIISSEGVLVSCGDVINRTTNFAKLNTEALFNTVDFDKSGEITEDEWLAFWEIVKKSGHTEIEINEEVIL
jgi:phosphotransacetylase